MKATITQENGASLCIESIPGSEGCLISARLFGVGLSSEITVGYEPASEDMSGLSSFFSKASVVTLANPAHWMSLCQDPSFTVAAEPDFDGALFLRVYMGSNSDDETDWQVNAALRVTQEQLLSFAEAVP